MRNIAIFLALFALGSMGVARTAEARGTGSAVGAAAAKMSRGAQIKLNRMKQKMTLRTRGAMQQKTRRQLRLGKRKLQRAMSRREIGLRTSETDRTRARFARNVGDGDLGPDTNATSHAAGFRTPDVTQDHLEESSSAKQRKKMRDRVRRSNTPPKKKIPKRRGED